MTKLISIATSIGMQSDKFGRTAIAHRTVAIDENGNAWELIEDGVVRTWKALPAVPEAAPEDTGSLRF